MEKKVKPVQARSQKTRDELLLGDKIDDLMVKIGVKWLHQNVCNVLAMASDTKDYAYHDYPKSMLVIVLPFSSALILKLAFTTLKKHPEECKQTRIDIDRRLSRIIKEWQ